MLARLTRIPGITGAVVESTGSWFLVTARDPAALERALPAVRDVLGSSAEPVEGIGREQQLAERARGELWFSADTIRALSFIEGRALAIRTRDFVLSGIALDAATAGLLLETIRVEIVAALNHAHDTGGRASTGWFWKEWPAIAQRILLRLRPRLTPAEAVRIEASLLAASAGINP